VREVLSAEAHRWPHGFDAASGEAIEAAVLDLGDQAVAAQFGDQAGCSMGSALGFRSIFGHGSVELGLEVPVAEPVDGKLSGKDRGEQRHGIALHRIERRDAAAASGVRSAQAIEFLRGLAGQ